jgi:hypothetical protein
MMPEAQQQADPRAARISSLRRAIDPETDRPFTWEEVGRQMGMSPQNAQRILRLAEQSSMAAIAAPASPPEQHVVVDEVLGEVPMIPPSVRKAASIVAELIEFFRRKAQKLEVKLAGQYAVITPDLVASFGRDDYAAFGMTADEMSAIEAWLKSSGRTLTENGTGNTPIFVELVQEGQGWRASATTHRAMDALAVSAEEALAQVGRAIDEMEKASG